MKSHLFSRPASLVATAVVAVAASVAAQAAPGVPSNHGVGVNLTAFDYFSPDFPMIDQFKRGGGWFTQCSYPRDAGCKGFAEGQSGWDTLEQAKMKVDQNGWPMSLPSAGDTSVKYRTVAALLFQDDSRVHPAGKYTVLYEGEGTIEYTQAGSKVVGESKPNRDIVNVTNSDNQGLLITIKATNPNNHIRNVRVLPPGGVCSLDKEAFALTNTDCSSKGKGTLVTFENLQGRVWHPNFVNDLRGFRTIRFLDWNKTNSSMLANWEDRPRWNDALWTGPYGVPVNALVSLANEAGADPWINLPTHATDDYAMRFARQLKGILAPNLNLIVEYSNEPWNYGFNQATWMRQQAWAKWEGAKDENGNKASDYTLQPSWYGMRAAQLCKIVKAEFGADASRVKCVFNGWAANSWTSAQQMDCPFAKAEMNGQACHKGMDAMAIAPYFGDYIKEGGARKTVKTWYSEPDGGVSKLFEEILAQDAKGNTVKPPLFQAGYKESVVTGAVGKSKGWMHANYKEASSRGMPMWAYEGGQHLVLAPGDTDQKYLDMITAANRDARMGTAYARTLSDWQAEHGQIYTLFNHVHRPSKYGAWGLKETQYQNSNHKWQAVLPYRDTKQCWWANCTR